MLDSSSYKIEKSPAANVTPLPATQTQAANGTYLINKHNALVDFVESAIDPTVPEKLSSLQASITNLQSSTDNLTTEVTTLRSAKDIIETSVAGLRTDVTNAINNVAALQASTPVINDLQTALTNLRATVEVLPTTASFTALQASILNLATRVNALESGIPNQSNTDQFWSNVLVLLHFEGSNNSLVFADEKGNSFTNNGAHISTSQFKFGSSSGYFDNNSFLASSVSTNFDANAVVTIESFIYLPSHGKINVIAHFRESTNGLAAGLNFYVNGDGKLCLDDGITAYLAGTTTLSLNTWHHVAYTRTSSSSNTTDHIFVDGVIENSSTSMRSFGTTDQLFIGQYSRDRVELYLSGYLDEMRITKGVSRYMANFTPPISAFSQ